jgi:hypothetical protein
VGLAFNVFDLLPKAPECEAQKQALADLKYVPGRWRPDDLQGLTDAAIERACLPSLFSHPKYIAHKNGFPPIPHLDMLDRAKYCAPFIYYRPCADTRALGYFLKHEIGEGLLDRCGFGGNHGDIQLAAVLLTIHSRDLFWLIQRRGVRGATSHLIHRHRYTPHWAIYVRVAVGLQIIGKPGAIVELLRG